MPKTYPILVFVARHGRIGAWLGGGLCGALAALLAPWGLPGAMLLGPLAGAAAWAALRLLAELIEVVAETLLPR